MYFSSGTSIADVYLTTTLDLNQWKHLVCVCSFPFLSIYIDGIEATIPGLKTNNISFSLTNVIRNYNYVGRSNWYGTGNQDSDADLDELKFFNRALTKNEIQFEMNNNL